jgi:mono/diheme cytochrome c family protein
MSPRLILSSALMPLAFTALTRAEEPQAPDRAKVEFFEKKIRPMLANHCVICHSADTNSKGGLRLDDRNGLLTGGNTGPAIVPGQPEKSNLLRRVTQTELKKRMPIEGMHLTDAEVADLTAWIKDGAAWPAVRVPASLGRPKAEYGSLRRQHWAWQPLSEPRPPAVRDAQWPRSDLDRFVLAKLESKKLLPVADADKRTLIRRVAFDLTGLPPTPSEVDAFLKDDSPQAFEKVADRLLASPQFGERWGRHWLDVARYGESTGPSRNIPYPHAWRYRDYVIDSINADVPFDRFVREQIAGDLLPAKSSAERDRLNTATGFLALGVKDVNQRFKVRFEMDNVDEQIDAVSRGFLALTVTCARCHDHKFDPIPARDYYALAGIFTSTENCAGLRSKMGGGGLDYYNPAMLVKLTEKVPPPAPDQVAKLKKELDAAKKAWDKIRGTPEGLKPAANGMPAQRPFRLKYERLQAEFNGLADPAARGYAVHGVRDSRTPADTTIRIRGEAEKIGPSVPRGFLTAFEVPGSAKVNPQRSGRLELAEWLASPKNPLTPRVAVNRVWANLFGRGIVSTVDNFGSSGDTPANAELLDHLANRFIEGGWSVKKLVRMMVLSRAYQLSSSFAPSPEFRDPRLEDPANKLIWRHSPRRLETEEIRDAMLAAAGTLDPKRTAANTGELKMTEMRDNGPEAAAIYAKADRSTSRSVYLPLLRGVTPRTLEAFDPVEQTLVTGSRDATTVPGQALFLLNSSFVRKQSLALAERLLKQDAEEATNVRSGYRLILGREPTEKEIDRARAFVADYESAYRAAPPPAPRPNPVARKKDARPTAANPDEIDQSGESASEDIVRPKDARTAAWLAFVQVLFASAEFRFVR